MKKIKLSQGKFAIVDDIDFESLSKFNWYCDNNRAVRNATMVNYKRTKRILMHRQIICAPEGIIVDHINMNPLDNRRENLRLANRSQNGMNRIVKGVYWHKRIKKWQASITKNRVQIHLGYFETKEQAQQVRLEAEVNYFGSFARQVENDATWRS
jgi:hypothetical protein